MMHKMKQQLLVVSICCSSRRPGVCRNAGEGCSNTDLTRTKMRHRQHWQQLQRVNPSCCWVYTYLQIFFKCSSKPFHSRMPLFNGIQVSSVEKWLDDFSPKINTYCAPRCQTQGVHSMCKCAFYWNRQQAQAGSAFDSKTIHNFETSSQQQEGTRITQINFHFTINVQVDNKRLVPFSNSIIHCTLKLHEFLWNSSLDFPLIKAVERSRTGRSSAGPPGTEAESSRTWMWTRTATSSPLPARKTAHNSSNGLHFVPVLKAPKNQWEAARWSQLSSDDWILIYLFLFFLKCKKQRCSHTFAEKQNMWLMLRTKLKNKIKWSVKPLWVHFISARSDL